MSKTYYDFDWPMEPSEENPDVDSLFKQYLAAIDNYNKIGEFKYSKQNEANDILGKIQNPTPFEYNLNDDALYQQYADQYARMGKMAMQDTMGKAVALTGGYGNSYAATAGNQAYNAYMQDLNAIVPDLYSMARSEYDADRNDLYKQYSILMGDYERELTEYNDKKTTAYNNLTASVDALENIYGTGEDVGTGKLSEDLSWLDPSVKERLDSFEDLELLESWVDDWTKLGELSEEEAEAIKAYYLGNEEDMAANIPQSIIDKVKGFTTNQARADYLAALENEGWIDPPETNWLLKQYNNVEKDFKNRTWTWVGDKNRKDKNNYAVDQYGNKKSFKAIKEQLIEDGMTESEAEDFIEDIKEAAYNSEDK